MNKTIIYNDFTGYHHVITHKGELPALATVRHHIRRSRAHDCQSVTKVTQRRGEHVYEIAIVPGANSREDRLEATYAGEYVICL